MLAVIGLEVRNLVCKFLLFAVTTIQPNATLILAKTTASTPSNLHL